MIRAWLDLPAFGIFATLFLLYFGAAWVLAGVIFRSPVRRGIASLTGVVAPFFSAVARIASSDLTRPRIPLPPGGADVAMKLP